LFYNPSVEDPTVGVGFDTLRPEQRLINYDYRQEAIQGANELAARIEEANKNVADVRNRIMSGQFAKNEFGAPVYTITVEDLKLNNWLVELNSSANVIENRRFSYAMEVKSFKNFYPDYPSALSEDGRYTADTADGSRTRLDDATGYYAPGEPLYRKYLGVRVHFPSHTYNAYAVVRPPYNLPVFDVAGKQLIISYEGPVDKDNPPKMEMAGGGTIIANDQLIPTKNGVLHNVGTIKYIKARVSGRNFHNGFAIRLRDQNEEVTEYFLGYLDYPGWRTLIWKNPNYITAVPQRDIFRIPLYPQERPYRIFDSVVFYRNGNDLGGDFVSYVWDIMVDYDLAVSPDEYEAIDINDDYYWKILRDINVSRMMQNSGRFAERLNLIKQEYARVRRTPNP
jgi:hypothetical protein